MLQIMDFIVNAILPILLLFPGFFVILDQEEFIEAVLNAAALLYITGIDDQLPLLLGCNKESIVKNYLIEKAMEEFDSIMKENNGNKNNAEVGNKSTAKGGRSYANNENRIGISGVQFCDYYLTNMVETGSSPTDGVIFQPFQIRFDSKADSIDYYKSSDYKIDPSRVVTDECLIRKITWQYYTVDTDNRTIHPRISYLELDLLYEQRNNQNPKHVIVGSKAGKDPNQKYHELEGVFIITTFQMTSDNHITRLRLCGSKDRSNFLKAFEYYPLWNLSKGSRYLLTHGVRMNVGGGAIVQTISSCCSSSITAVTNGIRMNVGDGGAVGQTKSSRSSSSRTTTTVSYHEEEEKVGLDYNRMAENNV
mmetsp:Transcript_6697/g.12598  ORF Transcript_6697/g.12598 Transcript_6697/m.12598 type:complete len:364 (-) Transcript_6697:785-1876(-)